MSDIDDELLELIEADSDTKKRKKTKSKGSVSKRRKTDDSDDDDEELYPLEGKYVDEHDRERLLSLSEFEREDIIAKRLEEKDKRNQSQKLSEFFAANQADSVSNAAKRQHTARGATKEKDKKLNELKAKRKAKADTKHSSPKRDRSSSPMDMETDDEEEEGQISKSDQDDDSPNDNEGITKDDLIKCWLPRDALVRHSAKPWFEELLKGAWVRYLIGNEGITPVYRICEVVGISSEPAKPYKIGDKTFDQSLELKHGKSSKIWLMDKVSNSLFDQKEFDRLVKTCEADSVRLPSKKDLERKKAQISKLSTQTMTESDVAAMLAKKNQLTTHKATGLSTFEKARLKQARALAERRQDYNEVAQIDAKLSEFGTDSGDLDDSRKDGDVLAKLSERNRKANSEAVRRAELMEAERRRRERKLGKSGTATPPDPSARLRTVPRTMLTASPSRSGTPNPGSESLLQAPPDTQERRPGSPLVNGSKLFESTVVNSIEVDLGDF